MSDRSNMIYVYDGSFDGLMCCIFESVYRNERPAAIQPEADGQGSLFEVRHVETDENRAGRVKDAIKQKISKNALHFVKKAFLTCLENKELLIVDFLQDGFKRGWLSMNDIAGSFMQPLYNAVRALDNEAEAFKGFVRFSELGGVLVAVIEPKNYVLPMLMGHFCARFHDETLMIYDKTHHMVLLGQNGQGRIAYLDEFTPAEADENELEMRRMWKHFYDVECKSEGHIKYHIAYTTFIVAPFECRFGIESSHFHGSFHVSKHSKADEMKSSIAEVNVTSPKRMMCGHFLLCYCYLLLFQQSRC